MAGKATAPWFLIIGIPKDSSLSRQELNTFLTDHTALEHRIPTIRSFAENNDTVIHPEGEMIELDPSEIRHHGSMYSLAAAKNPRKLASALAKVAARPR